MLEMRNMLGILVLLWLMLSMDALFPGAVPEEGDVRHVYPKAEISVGLDLHAHVLPFVLGWLENIEYPKNRINLNFFVLNTEDTAYDQVNWWKTSVTALFSSIKVEQADRENWLEMALRSARMGKADFTLITTGDFLPMDKKLMQNCLNSKFVVTIPRFSTVLDGRDHLGIEIEETELDAATLPLVLNLTQIDVSYLTFDGNNLVNYQGTNDPFDVFTESASRMKIPLHVDTSNFYGWYLDERLEMEDRRILLRYLLADLVASGVSLPMTSRVVRAASAEPSLWDVDQVFVINLKRRPDRLKKMQKIYDILGVNYTVMEAVDGHALPSEPKISVLKGYEDPFHHRPIKAGEIGCFLSHYRIWEKVKAEGLKRVIVFEDDLRFAENGLERIREVLEDLNGSHKPWDLIYLGRKRNVDQEELWVPNHRHLSTVGYSYWTLGYLLSLEGAEKLLAPRPLERLLPVDEYLPIMFNKHPNQDWNSQFPIRDLVAFTLHPLTVYPQFYTNEAGYVSDTEDSHVITAVDMKPRKEEL